MKIAVADVNLDGLAETGKEVAAIVGEANVLVVPTDVSNLEQVVRLRDKVYEAWGEVSFDAPTPRPASADPPSSSTLRFRRSACGAH